MLQGSIFWVLTIILLIAIIAIILVQGPVHLYNAPIVGGCSLLSVYLVIYVIKIHKKTKSIIISTICNPITKKEISFLIIN